MTILGSGVRGVCLLSKSLEKINIELNCVSVGGNWQNVRSKKYAKEMVVQISVFTLLKKATSIVWN